MSTTDDNSDMRAAESRHENSDDPDPAGKGGPALECPFCGEECYLRHHLGDCPEKPDDGQDMKLTDYATGGE